jgi:hypothetical protein
VRLVLVLVSERAFVATPRTSEAGKEDEMLRVGELLAGPEDSAEEALHGIFRRGYAYRPPPGARMQETHRRVSVLLAQPVKALPGLFGSDGPGITRKTSQNPKNQKRAEKNRPLLNPGIKHWPVHELQNQKK